MEVNKVLQKKPNFVFHGSLLAIHWKSIDSLMTFIE